MILVKLYCCIYIASLPNGLLIQDCRNILDCSSYKGNILKILRGALDKPRLENSASTEVTQDSDQSTIAGSINRAKTSESNMLTGTTRSLRTSGVSELA